MKDLNLNSLPQVTSVALGNAAVAANNAAQNVNQANFASQPDSSETTGLAEFNERAGVKHHGKQRHRPVTLQERLRMPMPRRVPMRTIGNAIHLDTGEHDEHLEVASASVIDALKGGARSDLEERLADSYDVLERHALLRYTRAKVDESDFSQTEKDRLANELNGMLDDLMDKYGDIVRAGLASKEAFESALGTMNELSAASNAAHHPGSLSELRAMYGAKGGGKLEAALTPLGLARSLQEKFGADNFGSALSGLRSKMAAEFRTRPADSAGPRLWLSLTDASAFNTVQSGFALAGELRRDLSERAGIVANADQTAIALTLLGVTEHGRGRADLLVNQIADSKSLAAMQRMQLYLLVRQVVDKIPITAWQKEMLSQRMNLLDELRTMALTVSENIPRAKTHDDQFEEEMRGKVRGKKKQGGRNGGDSGGGQGGQPEEERQDTDITAGQ